MRRIVVYLLFLPMFVSAQNISLTKNQSKTKIEALNKLSEKYNIKNTVTGDLFIVSKNDKYGVVDINGNTVIPLEYINICYENEGNLFCLYKDGHVGFANRKGELIIPFNFEKEFDYEGVDYFNKGMMCAEIDGKFGITDLTGRIVVPYVYDGLIDIANVERKLMYHHTSEDSYLLHFDGDTVIGPASYIKVRDDGTVIVLKDGKYGIYNTAGIELIPCQYDDIPWFVNGKAVVLKSGEGYGVIDQTGREIVPCTENRFDGQLSTMTKSGLVLNMRNYSYGVLDMEGNVVIPHRYTEYYSDTQNRIVLMDSSERVIVFDVNGRVLESYDAVPYLDQLTSYRDGIPVCKNKKWGYVDNEWNLVVPARYKDIYKCEDNYYVVQFDDDQRGVIDKSGKILLKGPYENVYMFCDGIFRVYSYEDVENENSPYVVGFVDSYGNTTLTKRELAKMKELMLKHSDTIGQ